METTFLKKCEILSYFQDQYEEDPEYQDFFKFHNIGLPLAFLNHNNLAVPQSAGIDFVERTFDDFLEMFGLEDLGFSNLEHVLANIKG